MINTPPGLLQICTSDDASPADGLHVKPRILSGAHRSWVVFGQREAEYSGSVYTARGSLLRVTCT